MNSWARMICSSVGIVKMKLPCLRHKCKRRSEPDKSHRDIRSAVAGARFRANPLPAPRQYLGRLLYLYLPRPLKLFCSFNTFIYRQSHGTSYYSGVKVTVMVPVIPLCTKLPVSSHVQPSQGQFGLSCMVWSLVHSSAPAAD